MLSEIHSFLVTEATVRGGDRLLIAFSGGPDSTSLALGLRHLQPVLRFDLHALHIDHGMDPDSRRRAAAAVDLSHQIGIPCTRVQRSVPAGALNGESPEMAARRIRYAALETHRRSLNARYVLTAHHADDQIETLLLRLLYGTGLEGLSCIRPLQGHLLRPLLTVRRSDLRRFLRDSGLVPIEDPTNLRVDFERNRIRHRVRPRLEESEGRLDHRVEELTRAALAARSRIEDRLRRDLALCSGAYGVEFSLQALQSMRRELWPFALSLIHRESGIPYPPSLASRRELEAQLTRGGRIGCDCGGGWRWESRGNRLGLVRHRTPAPSFAYTVVAPGECEIVELGLRFRIRQGAVDSWMFRPSSWRAGLALPLEPGQYVTVRSRRTGDRVRPFGCTFSRRLKDVFIDRKVPRQERSRLPLLEVDSRLAWIPGITIDDTCRVEASARVWIAELESIQGDGHSHALRR